VRPAAERNTQGSARGLHEPLDSFLARTHGFGQQVLKPVDFVGIKVDVGHPEGQ
jgi:hypothetical protein